MANNCCPTSFTDGGVFNSPTIITGTIVNSTATGLNMTGGVTLDGATATSFAEQLCSHLETCINSYINGGNFTNVGIVGATLFSSSINGPVSMDATAKTSIAQALCADLETCIDGYVNNGTFTGITLDASTLNNASLTGTLTTDPTVISSFLASASTQLETLIEPWINSAVAAVTPESIGAIAANAGVGTTTELMQPVITSGVIGNSVGSNNVFTGTRLVGPTTITGQVPLDTEALQHLCLQLQTCVDGDIGDLQHVDGVTIGGDGSEADPWHVIAPTGANVAPATTGDDLSTNVYGDRSALLGKPLTFLDFNGFGIPVYELLPLPPTP